MTVTSPTLFVVKLQIGHSVLDGAVLHFDASPVTDPDRQGSLAIDQSTLLSGVDLASTVRVFGDDGSVLFSGVIATATSDEMSGTIVMTLRSGSQRLREQRIGGLILGEGIAVPEAIYSILRLGGIKPDGMNLQGLKLPISEFDVVTPVLGVEAESAYAIGDITLFGQSDFEPLEELRSDEGKNAAGVHLVDTFGQARAWARTVVEAGSLFDAESAGVAKIRSAVAWLSLASRSSFSRTRSLDHVDYRRDLTQSSQPRMGTTAHVRSRTDARRWLRNLDGFRSQTDIAVAAGRSSLIREVAPAESHLTNAILSWQRARDSEDPSVQIGCLWQGLEQWVKGFKQKRPLFPPSLRKQLKADAVELLNEEQRKRFDDLVSDLNEPSLLKKIDMMIEEEQIPVSGSEMNSLRQTRNVRNRVEHGNALTELEAEDIRSAIAVLERLLVYSLS